MVSLESAFRPFQARRYTKIEDPPTFAPEIPIFHPKREVFVQKRGQAETPESFTRHYQGIPDF